MFVSCNAILTSLYFNNLNLISIIATLEFFLPSQLGLHTVNTKRYDTGTGTGTGETVPVVPVSLTAKRCL